MCGSSVRVPLLTSVEDKRGGYILGDVGYKRRRRSILYIDPEPSHELAQVSALVHLQYKSIMQTTFGE